MRRFLANQALKPEALFSEWIRWVVSATEAETLYVLVDETKLQDRLGAMVVGFAYEGRCVPLAWRCYRANSVADYPTEGQVGIIEQLLHAVAPGIPADKRGLVLADRGIGTSPTLCQRVSELG